MDNNYNVGRIIVRLRNNIEIKREFNLLTRNINKIKNKFVIVPIKPGNDNNGTALSSFFIKINPDIINRLVIVNACIVALASLLIQQNLFE